MAERCASKLSASLANVSRPSGDAPPSAATGVAGITAAEEAVAVHQRVAEVMWRDSLKGAEGAARLRHLVREAQG